MGIEQQTGNIDQKAAERKEKGAAAFRGTYETALAFRDFERGCGRYENKESETFSVLVSVITDRCKNIAESAIRENDIDSNLHEDEITKQIETAEEMIVRFEEGAKDLKFIFPVRYQLKELRENLKGGDVLTIFESAIKLKNYYEGFMYANEVLLTKADEASESWNSVTKK